MGTNNRFIERINKSKVFLDLKNEFSDIKLVDLKDLDEEKL